MPVNRCRRNVRTFKCVILVCVVVSLSVSAALFGHIHGTFYIDNKNRTDFFHPRNIFPAMAEENVSNSQAIKSVEKLHINLTDQIQLDLPKPHETGEMAATVNFNKTVKEDDGSDDSQPCYNVHAFYYPWYGTPEQDGSYYHWNHIFIPHWNKKEAAKWPKGNHEPPDDVGSNFYPALGPYSSADPAVVDEHMRMMKKAKIGVVVVSWYPPGDADTQGKEPDSLMNLVLDSASKHNLKVTVHVEPFKDRNQDTMKEQMKYILTQYGHHPAFYRRDFGTRKNLPLIYIYDSYLTSPQDWAKTLSWNSPGTIRNTELDGIFIGLWVEAKHGAELANSGFDGFYTYFATNQFTYGSSWNNWQRLSSFAKAQNMLFIPSVGPGYVDTGVRPWNNQNTRQRHNGKYYNESVTNALKHNPDIVSITSFNEWHEGTQIEPAVPKAHAKRKYLDYAPYQPDFYLKKTRDWVTLYQTRGRC